MRKGEVIFLGSFRNLWGLTVASAHKIITAGDPVHRLPLQIQGYTDAPIVRFFDEAGLNFFAFGRHDKRVYLENILLDAIGLNTADDIDFNNPDVINYLTQVAPHAFDFLPLVFRQEALEILVNRIINTNDALPFINGVASKLAPVLM